MTDFIFADVDFTGYEIEIIQKDNKYHLEMIVKAPKGFEPEKFTLVSSGIWDDYLSASNAQHAYIKRHEQAAEYAERQREEEYRYSQSRRPHEMGDL